MASSVPDGVTAGTPAFVKFGIVAFAAPDVAGPTMAATPSFVVKLAATVAASLLSDLPFCLAVLGFRNHEALPEDHDEVAGAE